ncbi:MAG: spore coat U domain-containing protein, partial [Polyangiales bacterium]
GAYDVYGPNLDAAGSLSYVCTGVAPGDNVVITLETGGASSFTPRQMQSGPYRLDYNIYLDATRISIWGDGTAGSVVYGPVVPPEALPTVVPMYGRIPAGQDAQIGAYVDTIIVTMSY